jgi:hypothetical protein
MRSWSPICHAGPWPGLAGTRWPPWAVRAAGRVDPHGQAVPLVGDDVVEHVLGHDQRHVRRGVADQGGAQHRAVDQPRRDDGHVVGEAEGVACKVPCAMLSRTRQIVRRRAASWCTRRSVVSVRVTAAIIADSST